MIAYSYIERNLRALDSRYRSPKTSTRDANFVSKLAMLELCGWIEVSMDDCILRASIRVLKDEGNRRRLEEKVLRNYGFEYERHFKSMMIQVFGLWGFEKIFRSVDATIAARFSSELGRLKTKRNTLAHTYTPGVTEEYDAPSAALGSFAIVKSGLQAYDSAIRKHF